MGGYCIYSVDASVFQQLTTAPMIEQCRVLADEMLEVLEDAPREYKGGSVDPNKWPTDREALTKLLQMRLASPDWYADLTYGDAVIWDSVVSALMYDEGEQTGISCQCENDGMLYWDAAEMAAEHGAPMMAERNFGGGGFRCSGKARTDLELMYTIYLPAEVQKLLAQLEKARPHFEAMVNDDDDERVPEEYEEFFDGLLKPVRKIADAGRVMWVRT